MEEINSWRENEKVVRAIMNKTGQDINIDDLLLQIKRRLYEELSLKDIKEDYMKVAQYIKKYFSNS